MTNTTVDFEAIKDKQRAAWQTGDYPRVGNTLLMATTGRKVDFAIIPAS